MKIQFLTSYYPPFLDNFFASNSDLLEKPYDVILDKLLGEHFADTGALEFHTKKAGHNTFLIISNSVVLQKKWAKENNVSYTEENWMTDIAFAQIKQFKPDVFYLEYVYEFFGDFLREIKPFCKYIASWISSPLNDKVSLNGVDLIFSSTPDFINSFREKGFKAEYMHPAFDVRILAKLKDSKKDIPFSFVGGWSAAHVNRMEALKVLSKRTPIQIWGYNYIKSFPKKNLAYFKHQLFPENKEVLRAFRGEIWGLKMYDVLHRSVCTFNIHESLLKGYVGNMRMFEATGVGAMILNDEGKNLQELFTAGKEIETYKTIDEAVEKVNFYLENPKKAIEIGKNAQARTVKDYNFDIYVQKLFDHIKKHSRLS